MAFLCAVGGFADDRVIDPSSDYETTSSRFVIDGAEVRVEVRYQYVGSRHYAAEVDLGRGDETVTVFNEIVDGIPAVGVNGNSIVVTATYYDPDTDTSFDVDQTFTPDDYFSE